MTLQRNISWHHFKIANFIKIFVQIMYLNSFVYNRNQWRNAKIVRFLIGLSFKFWLRLPLFRFLPFGPGRNSNLKNVHTDKNAISRSVFTLTTRYLYIYIHKKLIKLQSPKINWTYSVGKNLNQPNYLSSIVSRMDSWCYF